MTDARVRTAVIAGSTCEGRFGDTVARWLVGRAALHSKINVYLIDLADAILSAVQAALKTKVTP